MKPHAIVHTMVGLGLLLQAAGCASKLGPQAKTQFVNPDYKQRQPASVAVLAVEDARVTAEKEVDLSKLRESVCKALEKHGYDALPCSQAEAWSKYDAVMQSRLSDYDARYKGLYRTDRFEMHFTLFDAKTRDRLWEHQTSYHETGVHGLVGSALAPDWTQILRNDWRRSLPFTDKVNMMNPKYW